MRRELLNAYLFHTLHEVSVSAEEWRKDYNEERPHKSSGYLSPVNYLKKWEKAKAESNSEAGLSTPASENDLSFETQPVMDKPTTETIPNPLIVN